MNVACVGDGAGQLVNIGTPFDFGFGAGANILADLDGNGDLDAVTTNLMGLGVMMNLSISLSSFDLNGDGVVGSADLAALLQGWGQPGRADFDHSGAVDGADLANLLANWTNSDTPAAQALDSGHGSTRGPDR